MTHRNDPVIDTGTDAVFSIIDQIARHLAEHGETSAICAAASLALMCVTHADHNTACSARMQLLELIAGGIYNGEDWLSHSEAS